MVIRAVFLGTPDFAVASLRALIADSEVEVIGVFTQPDRKAGRGQKVTSPPVKRVALEAGLPVFQPERVRGNPAAVSLLRELDPTIGVVVAFGQILTTDFFDLPPFGTVNVHASLLPAYRGASPIAHALLNGESETGVTIMKIDAGMDTGDLLRSRRVAVPPDITAGELEDELARIGAQLLVPTLKDYVAGTAIPVPQPQEGVSLAPRLKKEDGLVDWSGSARSVHDRIRAMNPWPVARSRWRDEEIKFWRSQTGKLTGREGPGTITGLTPAGLEVACGEGSILLTELQRAGGRRMPASDFINGMRPRIGERFV